MKNTPVFGLPYIEVGDFVEDIAASSKLFVEGVESVMLSSEFQGPGGDPGQKGVQGDPGLPGVNAVPADDAVRTYIQTTSSLTRAALNSLFGDTAAASWVNTSTSALRAAVLALTNGNLDSSVAGHIGTTASSTRTAIDLAITQRLAPSVPWSTFPLSTGTTTSRAEYSMPNPNEVLVALGDVVIGAGQNFIGTLPAGARPKASIPFQVMSASGTVTFERGWVNSLGVIRLSNTAPAGTFTPVGGLIRFPIY